MREDQSKGGQDDQGSLIMLWALVDILDNRKIDK